MTTFRPQYLNEEGTFMDGVGQELASCRNCRLVQPIELFENSNELLCDDCLNEFDELGELGEPF